MKRVRLVMVLAAALGAPFVCVGQQEKPKPG